MTIFLITAQFAAEEDNVECLQILLKHGMRATNPPNIDELEEQSEYETQKYCWQILFAAGSHLGFCPFMDYIKHNSNHDYFSLLHLCRTALRKHLLRCSPNNNLFCLVPRLDIPERLKSYLLYNMSLENENLIAPYVRTESPQRKHSRPLRRNLDPPRKLAFDENLTNKKNSRKVNNDTLEKEMKLRKNEVEECSVKEKRQRKVADDLSLKEKRLRKKVIADKQKRLHKKRTSKRSSEQVS